ncbi:MAG: hypothetical protein CMR00_00880 [[Chlorobium] sp. 445]|nr:MAG: hypothetical protein CMR00_00880 [[Chlorobium] sp. 445]
MPTYRFATPICVALVISLWGLTLGCQSTTSSLRYKAKPATRDEVTALESEVSSATSSPKSNDKEVRLFYASLKRASLGTPAKARLQEEINRYVGTQYRYGGQDAQGFDCSGFTGKIFRDALNIELPRSSSAQAQIGTPVAKPDLQFGDLVFFNIYGKGISHVGVYIGNGNFAHASVKIGVTISNLSERYYQQRYVTARRIVQLQ